MAEIIKDYSQLKPGMVISVYQKIKEVNAKGEEKERIQVFTGTLISKKGKEADKTITVLKHSHGVNVEKIFPLNLPEIDKIEVVKQYKARQSKLYYLLSGFNKKKLREVKTS